MPTESGTQMKSTFISFEKGRHYIETSELPILLSEQALLNQCESSSGQERISISMQKKKKITMVLQKISTLFSQNVWSTLSPTAVTQQMRPLAALRKEAKPFFS